MTKDEVLIEFKEDRIIIYQQSDVDFEYRIWLNELGQKAKFAPASLEGIFLCKKTPRGSARKVKT